MSVDSLGPDKHVLGLNVAPKITWRDQNNEKELKLYIATISYDYALFK